MIRKRSGRENVSVEPKVEVDVAGLINKMQEQLVSLEKKIDSLIDRPSSGQTQERRYEYPRHNDRGRHGGNFRERNFYKAICADCGQECEVPFRPGSGRPVYCKECFSKRKGGGGSSFKEKHDDTPAVRYEKQESDKKKKPFSGRRKVR